MNPTDGDSFTVSGAARGAKCSEAGVRNAEKAGIIRATRDSSGRRLFTHGEVEKLRLYVEGRRVA
jgi:hypothetical protein